MELSNLTRLLQKSFANNTNVNNSVLNNTGQSIQTILDNLNNSKLIINNMMKKSTPNNTNPNNTNLNNTNPNNTNLNNTNPNNTNPNNTNPNNTNLNNTNLNNTNLNNTNPKQKGGYLQIGGNDNDKYTLFILVEGDDDNKISVPIRLNKKIKFEKISGISEKFLDYKLLVINKKSDINKDYFNTPKLMDKIDAGNRKYFVLYSIFLFNIFTNINNKELTESISSMTDTDLKAFIQSTSNLYYNNSISADDINNITKFISKNSGSDSELVTIKNLLKE